MKKLMIAACAVAVATMAQAAAFNWDSGEVKAYGVKASAVVDNGPYNASTSSGDRLFKSTGDWSYILTLYAAGTENVIGSASGTMVFDLDNGYIQTTGIEIAAAQAGTTYDYKILISGVQDNLQKRGVVGDYDYSAATLDGVISGSITTELMGETLIDAVPTSWTVSGVESVPEPTSGLLLLLGVAGLALKRKRA